MPRLFITVLITLSVTACGVGLGSAHFIDASGVELDTVVANLQFEMIGRPRSEGAGANPVAHAEVEGGASSLARAGRRRNQKRADSSERLGHRRFLRRKAEPHVALTCVTEGYARSQSNTRFADEV